MEMGPHCGRKNAQSESGFANFALFRTYSLSYERRFECRIQAV